MAINLVTKYQSHLAGLYTANSFVKGKTSKEWDWNGSEHIRILSVVTQPLSNYNINATANRYGTPSEVQDTMQDLAVAQDKSFSMIVDKRNLKQGGMLKRAGEVLNREVKEQVVPFIDKYAIGQWAKNAGKVAAATATLSKTNIIEHLVAIEDEMSDGLVPLEGRYALMPNATVSLFRQSLMALDNITDRLLLKGIVGKLGTLNIIGVPATWMPTNTEVLAWQTRSVVLPEQIAEAKIHEDAPGFSGALLEGRYLFDAHVIGTYANGVYALVANGHKATAPTVAVAGTIKGTSGATIKYTIDGTDPRYSATAQTLTGTGSAQSVTHTSGDTIKAVEYSATDGTSDVASAVTTS